MTSRPVVSLDRIYTRGGDGGDTSLGDGARVLKHAPRIEALGCVEEISAAIGLVRAASGIGAEMSDRLVRIQNDLFDLGADLCVPERPEDGRSRLRIDATQVARLEREIDAINADLPPLTSFVLPGGSETGARLHLARTVARRAERRVSELAAAEVVNPDALRYLNRLSDLLFVAARWVDRAAVGDELWVPGAGR